MLVARPVGNPRKPHLLASAWLWMPAFLIAGLWLSDARADSAELLAQRVRNALQQQSLKRIVLAVQEENAGQADDETRTGMAELAKRLEAACRQAGIAPIAPGPDAGLGDFSLTKLPDLDEVAKVLEDSKTDAVLAIAWKPTKTGVAIRVTLINDRKVLWNNRTTLSRSALKSQAAAKSKSTTLAKIGGTVGKGANSNGNFAGAAALGSNLPFGSTAAGLPGSNGLTPSGHATGDDASNGPVSALNARILEFAASQLGRQVGNGECWTLAAEALKSAGARPPVVYDFGDEVEFDQLQPGDVLHFETAVFITPTYRLTMGAPDHVAVVGAARGTSLLIYHQNVNGDRRVQTATIDLATRTSGSVVGYRAQGRGSQKAEQSEAK